MTSSYIGVDAHIGIHFACTVHDPSRPLDVPVRKLNCYDLLVDKKQWCVVYCALKYIGLLLACHNRTNNMNLQEIQYYLDECKPKYFPSVSLITVMVTFLAWSQSGLKVHAEHLPFF